jgi:nucleotide-binding universal stress UspA family protein
MYRVLVPIDSSEERTAAQVEAVASLPDAAGSVEATLLHVFEDRETAESTSATQLRTGGTVEQQLLDHGVAVQTESRYGDPAEEILEAAEGFDADLIVLGGRKRSPLGSLLFGSVSQAVTLDATRPVVVTGGVKQSETEEEGEGEPAPAA